MFFDNIMIIEVVTIVLIVRLVRAISGRRLKPGLFRLKVEKAHISGKLLPFATAHQVIRNFLLGELTVSSLSASN